MTDTGLFPPRFVTQCYELTAQNDARVDVLTGLRTLAESGGQIHPTAATAAKSAV